MICETRLTIVRARYPSSQSVSDAAMKMDVTTVVDQGAGVYHAANRHRTLHTHLSSGQAAKGTHRALLRRAARRCVALLCAARQGSVRLQAELCGLLRTCDEERDGDYSADGEERGQGQDLQEQHRRPCSAPRMRA